MTWHSDIVRQRRLYRFYRPFQRIALASADRIIVPTPKHFDSSNQLTGIGVDAKIRYIPLGIDFDKLHATPSEPLSASSEQLLIGRRIVFSVGRHVSYKGYSYLVRAARFLPKEVVVVIAGEGPLTPQLKQLANELESDARVVFPGRLSQGQLVGLFRRCSVFTLPSITQAEAFGLATAEAMSFGKPAIVCQLANGVNYLNRHGYTGLTVPPMHPIALADAIQTLVSNESLSTQLGHQAREWVIKQFSVEVMRQGMHSLYKELL
jgi:rhamnosyl/mannosyltransferase